MLRNDGPLTPLAGATDLYVALNFGTLESTRFLNLSALHPLRRITLRNDTLRIGALATYTALLRSRLVRRRLPMLASAAREVGGMQIQNRGTLGGNVANGRASRMRSPTSDREDWSSSSGCRAAPGGIFARPSVEAPGTSFISSDTADSTSFVLRAL